MNGRRGFERLLASLALTLCACKADRVDVAAAADDPSIQGPVSAAALGKILSDSLSCRAPAERGVWAESPEFLAVGPATILPDGRTAVADIDRHQIRIFDSLGHEHPPLGRRGAGPGEMERAPTLFRWLADTIAVLGDSHLSLFAGGRFVRQVMTVTPNSQGVFLGVLSDRTLLFMRPLNPEHSAGRSRGILEIIGFQEKDPTLRVLHEVPGTETIFQKSATGSMSARAPFARRTWIYATKSGFVVYDDASSRIEVLDALGKTVNTIGVPILDVTIPEHERDSVRAQFGRGRGVSGSVRDEFARVAERRAAIDRVLVDADDGIWIRFHPSIARGNGLYVRMTLDGVIDRCFRPGPSEAFDPRPRDVPAGSARLRPRPDGSVLAFSRDHVLQLRTGEDADRLFLLRTAPIPR